MKKYLQKKLKDQKGMTLIELLAVIVIIAIIAAIAIPAIGNIIENSRVNAVKADYQNVLSAANLYFTETGASNGAVFEEDTATVGDFLDDEGSLITFTVTKAAGGNTIVGTAESNGVDYNLSTATTNETLSGYSVDQFKTAVGITE